MNHGFNKGRAGIVQASWPVSSTPALLEPVLLSGAAPASPNPTAPVPPPSLRGVHTSAASSGHT